MRRRLRSQTELITKVNVTPIIDVALVLVIILLVTAPMITATDLRIQLPQAHTRTAEDQRNVSITLGPDGDVRLDQKPVPTGKLRQALQARLAQPGSEDDLVIICADASVHYGKVNALLDEARHAGAKRLAIATQHKADDRR